MTPSALLAAMILTWIGVLAGLWRVATRIEQLERRLRDHGGGLRAGERRG